MYQLTAFIKTNNQQDWFIRNLKAFQSVYLKLNFANNSTVKAFYLDEDIKI